ncbi:MAG: CHASE4 domain-containing protein, partial [Pseudomonadota bacterium]
MMTHSSIEERTPEGTQQNQAIQNSFVVGSNGELRPTTGGSVRVLARPFWFLFSLSFVGLLVFLAVMTVALNRSSIQSSEHVFNSLIDNRIEQLKPLARGYAYWDEAVESLVEDFDRSWAVNNIGIYLLQQGIDAAYVVNNDDQIVVSVVNGEVIQPAPGWSFTPEIWALIRDARATEDDAPPIPVAGKVTHSAGYAIAAAARMTTYT